MPEHEAYQTALLREATNNDKQTELDALNEIEDAVKEMKKQVQKELKEKKP